MTTTIIINRDQYIKEAHQQLLDEKVYCKLTIDPTGHYKIEIDVISREAFESSRITREIRTALTNEYPIVALLYFVP